MSLLKIQEENCSAFGRLILQYLKDNPKINMSQLATQIGVTHAGLSWICLRHNSPSEETAAKVASVLNIDLTKLARLVYENKLQSLADLNALNYAVKANKSWVTRRVPVEDAIATLNAVFHAHHYLLRSVSETEKLTDFQIYKQSYEIIKRHFLKSGNLIKQSASSGQKMNSS